MSCLSQEEIREALFGLVANKLYKKAEKDEVLDLPAYVKEIYYFVKEASEDEATAISAAAMTPVIIDKILSASDKLTEKLENKNPDVRIDVLQLLRKFKNNTDAVRETVGATKPVAIDDSTLKSSASIKVTDERPTSKIKESFNRFMTWAFQTFRVDIKNYMDPSNLETWMKPKVEEALNFTVQKKINKALQEQGINDSSEMKLDGVEGGVYLRAMDGDTLFKKHVNLIPKTEKGLTPFLSKNDIYMVLTNEAGEPIQFDPEGTVVKDGQLSYLRAKSKAPMDAKGNFISHEDPALERYIDINVKNSSDYSNKAKTTGANAVKAIAKSIQDQIEMMAKSYNPKYGTKALTTEENEELKNRASNELKKEYAVLEKMREYVKANPDKFLLSVMTGTAEGFVPYSPYVTTPLKDINFEQGFQPRVIKEIQSATSNVYQSGVYFDYPNIDEPISINKKPLVQQDDILNSVIDLFTKDLWMTINGVLQPVPIGRREELLNQFIVNDLHNVYFMADRKSGTINYEDKDGTINIMINGTRYPLKFDGSKSGQEAAAAAIRKHLSTGMIVYDENGRYPEDKSINTKPKALKAASALNTQIVYAEYETDENGIKTIKPNDLERVNKPGVYAIQKGTNYDFVGTNGQPEYDYFHANVPSIVIVDKLIEPGYDEISFTQEGDKVILNTKNASYKDFLKNNFTTNAVPYNYNNTDEKGKIEVVNSSVTFSPTAESMIKLAGGEKNSGAVDNQEEIARLRAEEQELLKREIPNIDAYKVDGKVNPFLIPTAEEREKYEKIWEYYDGKISPLLKFAPAEPKAAETKPTEPTIEPLTTKTTASLSPDDILNSLNDMSNESDFERNSRLKLSGARGSKEQLDAAAEWYSKSPLKEHFPFRVVLAALNAQKPGPAARWAVNGITLFRYFNNPDVSGDYTDLYHEAWHGFTQTFLTPEEREAMYEEARKKKGSFTDYNGKRVAFADAKWKQLEEYLAEDFRAYMMSGGKIKDKSSPTKNGIFTRIMNFLKELFSGVNINDVNYSPLGIPKIQAMYENLKLGNLSGYNFNVENRDKTIGALDHAMIASKNDENMPELDFETTNKIMSSVNSIISSYTNTRNLKEDTRVHRQVYSYTTTLMKDKTRALEVYKYIKSIFENEVLSNLNRDLADAKAKPDNEYEIIALEQDITGIQWAIDNFGDLTNLANNKDGKDVIGYHLKTSRLLTEEDRAELLEETSEVDALIKASEKFDRPGNDVGSYDMAPPEVKYVLTTIHKWEGIKPVMNSFGIQELSDPSIVWNRISRTLKGTMSASEMYEKLQAAAGKDPIIADLLKKLGPVKTHTAAETDLWIKFWSVFNKAEIPLMQMTVFREKDMEGRELDEYSIKIGSNNSVSRIAQTRWTNTFSTVTSDYRNRDPQKANEIYMDVKKVIEKFGTKQPNGQYKFTSDNNAYEFFRAIGIELSDSDELRDIVNKGKGKATRIFDRLNNILNRGTDKIYNLKDIFKEYPAVDKIAALSSETTLTDLANEEVKFADYASNYAVNNAEGNIQFEQSLHNSISIMISAINSSKNYADLISKPFMSHLDIDKNPFAKASVWLNSIYKMDEYKKGSTTDVGAKRDQKSDINLKAAINMSNLSGVSIVSDKRDEGVASASADEFTKLILDFHVSNVIGRPELMRHADKGTSFSLWLSDIITPGSSDNKSYVDTIDFIDQPSTNDKNVPGYDKASTILKKYIDAEMQRMAKLKALKDQKDLIYDAKYLKEGQDFVIFEDVLSPKTRAFLSNYPTLAEAAGVDPDISNDINKEISKYFDNQSKQVGRMMNSANYISKSLMVKTATDANKANRLNVTNKSVKNALIKSFVVNSWIHNIESMAIIYGDIAQYKLEKEEFHKRNAGAGSTGGLIASDPVFIEYVNSKRRLSTIPGRSNTYAEKMKIFGNDGQTKKLASDGSFQSAILEDNNIRSEYFEDIADALIDSEEKKLGSREKAIKKVLGFEVDKEGKETGKLGTIDEPFKNGSVYAFTEMNEGDAQGWITFDFYKATAILEGSWTPAQEKLYNKIINEEPVDYSEVLNFFPTKKYQYWGPVQHKDKDGKAIDGPPLTAMYKFSLFPLIPNVVKGKNLGALHTRMMEKGIDFAMFESGSKISNFTKINTDGKADKDKFYSSVDGQDRTVDATGDLVPNTVFLQFLKKQLEIAPYFKGKVSFPTQMRKLIENGLMEAGVPTDYEMHLPVKEREKLWRSLSLEKKLENSQFYRLVKNYEKNLSDLTKLKMKKLEAEASIKRDEDGNVIFNEKLAEFIIKELDRQDLAEHEIGFIKSGTNNTLAHDLSYSLSAEKIEKILNSIVVKRLVKQKFKGEGLIQVSGAGFEDTLRGKLTDEEKAKYGTNGLAFYKRKGGPNGTTSAMKVKIALQGSFENLLYLKDKDGKEIGTIERLNQLLKDESWLDIGDHRKMISITGPRIPTQENNSMEFAEVYEFLPREAGNIVILPSEIVAKSGGDFDIDKITFMMPNISSGINWASWLEEGSGKREELQKSTTLDLSAENVKRVIDNRKADELSVEDQAVLRILAENSDKNVKFPFDSKTEEGLENRILDDMKNILSLKENYVSLVRPNGTDIVKPLADELSSKVMDYNPKKRLYDAPDSSRIAGTRLFEIPYNMYKHTSNSIGKQTLGLGAVDNTFNTVFNRIGARMNYEYWGSRNVKRRLDLLFDHNTLQDDQGRDVISLSHLMDVNNDNSISSIIGQLINGWVDIAKDAWIFNLQGNKEISPSLLFLVQAGVPLKQAVYFVSQPIIREYVKEMQQAKSTFAGPMGKGTDNPNLFRGEARKLIFKKLGYNATQMAVFNENNEKKQEFLDKRTLELTDKKTGSEIDFFNPDKVEANLKNKIDAYAEAVKNQQNSSEEEAPLNYNYDVKDEAIFLHFLEVEEMTNSATKFKMALNVDTGKTNNIFEALSKNQLIDDLKADGKLPENLVKLIREESPIGSFFTQDFQIGLWKNLFKLRNDDDLNKWILNKTTSRTFKDEVDETFGDDERFVNNLRNDWISFLFQNQIRKFDIDKVKDYKGLVIQDTLGVKLSPSIKYGVFVAPDKTGALTVYMDKVKLRQDFAKLSNSTSLETATLLPDGTIIKPADVDAAAFPTPDTYYKFVVERELLRAMYPGKTKWSVLLERADVSRKLKDALESGPTFEGESKQKREARINTEVYEETLRDMALENTYNTWKMFQSRTSMADQFNEIAALYPELRKNYSLMNILTGTIRNDKNNSNRIGNLQLLDSLLDGTKLNLLHQNLKDMSDPTKLRINVKSAQERTRIAEFFNKFGLYAFLQSGLNTSGRFSLTRVVPQEMFTAMMSEYMGDFMKNMNELTFERYYTKFKAINSRAGSTSYRDYTVPEFDMAADKNKVVDNPVGSAKELMFNEKKSRIDNFYFDNAGNKLYHANEFSLNKEDTMQAITMTQAADILQSRPTEVIIFNGTDGTTTGQGTKGEAAFDASLSTHSNLIAFPVKKSYDMISGNIPNRALITDISIEEAERMKAEIKQQEKIINNLVSGPKLEVGVYAEYKGDNYIVTKKLDNGTWQLYNPDTGSKLAVSPSNFALLMDKPISLTNRDVKYWVSPLHNNAIISQVSNNKMNWPDENGVKREIMAKVQSQGPNKNADQQNITQPAQNTFKFADGTIINTPFKLNEQQEKALLSLENFYNKPGEYNNQITLLGYAGTGKTSIITIFDNYLKKKFVKPLYSSPTHRANAVTKMKNPKAAVYTLHKLFGLKGQIKFEDGDYDLRDLNFAAFDKDGKLNKNAKVQKGDILIVDEASMVNDALYDFLEKFKQILNLKIIYMGDPAQLKPVKQKDLSKTFEKGTQLQLTKVERTGDNPILEEATNLRNGKDFNYQTKMVGEQGVEYSDEANFTNRIIGENYTSDEFKDNKLYFRILSATNAVLPGINRRVRELLYGDEADKQLVKGDLLMGNNNFDIDYKTKQSLIINSGDYIVDSVEESVKTLPVGNKTISFNGFQVRLKNVLDPEESAKSVFIVSNSESDDKLKDFMNEIDSLNKQAEDFRNRGQFTASAQRFAEANELQSSLAFMKDLVSDNNKVKVKKTLDYGYAHTIHKSQGGTYNKVLILADTIDSHRDPETRQQLKYVAMSRASEKVYVATSHELGTPIIRDGVVAPGDVAPTVEPVESKQPSTNLPGPDTKINIYAGTGENAELSNFAERPFTEEDESNWNSVEQYFQYAKYFYSMDYLKARRSTATVKDKEDAEFNDKLSDKIANSSNSAEIKKLGSQFKQLDTTRWDNRASIIMKEALLMSFQQNPNALAKLLATGNATLTHTQDKGKWGTEFPRLLMEVRKELRGEQPQESNIPQDTRDGEDVQDDSKTPRPINGMVMDPFFKKKIDKTIQSMQQKKKAGMTLDFPVNGIGQHMIGADPNTGKLIGDIKPIALSSFVYLSEQLFEKFGYVNPNYEKVLGYIGEQSPIQAASEVTDDMLDTALSFCFNNIV
jgi:exodeoxyribonuclease-5